MIKWVRAGFMSWLLCDVQCACCYGKSSLYEFIIPSPPVFINDVHTESIVFTVWNHCYSFPSLAIRHAIWWLVILRTPREVLVWFLSREFITKKKEKRDTTVKCDSILFTSEVKSSCLIASSRDWADSILKLGSAFNKQPYWLHPVVSNLTSRSLFHVAALLVLELRSYKIAPELSKPSLSSFRWRGEGGKGKRTITTRYCAPSCVLFFSFAKDVESPERSWSCGAYALVTYSMNEMYSQGWNSN